LQDFKNDNFIRYMSRGVDAGIPNNEEDICFFYVKLPRFLIILPISGLNEKSLINTIIKKEGVYNINNTEIKDKIIGNSLINRVNFMYKELEKKSQKQEKSSQDFISKQNIDIEETDLGIIENYIKQKNNARK
jgi:hypothetical protein